jgi:peptidylprolyl isomerase
LPTARHQLLPLVPTVRSFARPAVVSAAVCLATFAAACREFVFEPEDPAKLSYAPALGINLAAFTQLPSGVYYQDVAVGSGAVVTDSSTIAVAYRGFLADGRSFDSTATGQTRSFPLGGVIAGWRSGLVGARAGGRRRLIIPADQAYGNQTRPGIPAGSVLYFVIDVASVTTPVTPPRTSRPTP